MHTQEKQMEVLVQEALAATAEIDRSGELYPADEVHAWLERGAKGETPTPLRPGDTENTPLRS